MAAEAVGFEMTVAGNSELLMISEAKVDKTVNGVATEVLLRKTVEAEAVGLLGLENAVDVRAAVVLLTKTVGTEEMTVALMVTDAMLRRLVLKRGVLSSGRVVDSETTGRDVSNVVFGPGFTEVAMIGTDVTLERPASVEDVVTGGVPKVVVFSATDGAAETEVP